MSAMHRVQRRYTPRRREHTPVESVELARLGGRARQARRMLRLLVFANDCYPEVQDALSRSERLADPGERLTVLLDAAEAVAPRLSPDHARYGLPPFERWRA